MSAYNRGECEDGSVCVPNNVKNERDTNKNYGEIVKSYQDANSFWGKYKWWIILIIVLLLIWFLFAHHSHKKSDVSIDTGKVYLNPQVGPGELYATSPKNINSLLNFI